MDNILIVGTGALATLFAARLSQAGYSVSLLGTWKEGIDALRTNGARLIDASGTEHQFEVQASDDPGEYVGTRLALVLVKAWQTERAAAQLRECLADDGLAITLQNGLGNYETLVKALGGNRVALGTITIGATLLGPGLVKAAGDGNISMERKQMLDPIEAALRSAKFNVQIVEDARSILWGKLVINAAINPLTALLRVPNGELLKRPSAQDLMEALACEVAEVAKAEGIELPFNDPVVAAEDVARKTAVNRSSMLQDVLRNAPTEIDAICGAVVEAAQRHGIDVPANWACWNLIKAIS
ncbi:MAG TPA: 2-dehydropantoate 2-reductase [Anaerolineales bacterium]|nr:2-dehydropantoate 2-reductase [Anaerolineales bacterium]